MDAAKQSNYACHFLVLPIVVIHKITLSHDLTTFHIDSRYTQNIFIVNPILKTTAIGFTYMWCEEQDFWLPLICLTWMTVMRWERCLHAYAHKTVLWESTPQEHQRETTYFRYHALCSVGFMQLFFLNVTVRLKLFNRWDYRPTDQRRLFLLSAGMHFSSTQRHTHAGVCDLSLWAFILLLMLREHDLRLIV